VNTGSQAQIRGGRDNMSVDDIDGAVPRRMVGVSIRNHYLNNSL
jgi:hypothetical protein